MTGNYAKGTQVDPGRSLLEIKQTLYRFGVDRRSVVYMEEDNRVGLQFQLNSLTVRMTMVFPPRETFSRDRYGHLRTERAIDLDWAQARREHWRTLAISVKAKLTMVEKGLSTFEREFLADIVLPSGQTVGDVVSIDPRALNQIDAIPQPPDIIALGKAS